MRHSDASVSNPSGARGDESIKLPDRVDVAAHLPRRESSMPGLLSLPSVSLPLAFLGQQFEWGDMVIVGLLVLLEGVLSIDNALVLGLLAKRLPPHQRPRALSYGLIGAFVFRVLAIATASFLLKWTFVKLLGGGYLIFIAVKHLFFEAQEEDGEKLVLDASGHPVLVDVETGGELTTAQEDLEIRERVPVGSSFVTGEAAGSVPVATGRPGERSTRRRGPSFWSTVAVIELTDIAFAVDSILAAMALAGSRQEKLWVVITGGILGVILMRFAAAVFVKLLDRFPRFEESAYLLVIVIGLKLVADWGLNSDWSQGLPGFESQRQVAVKRYEGWLDANWPLTAGGMKPAHDGHSHGSHAASDGPAASGIVHVPHLLDFHDLRRPECLAFWAAMAACFGIGFLPRRQHVEAA
jgi:YkoY family integral membrane protein